MSSLNYNGVTEPLLLAPSLSIDNGDVDNGDVNINPNNNEIIFYKYRWLIVLLFLYAGFCNSFTLLTWSPISDKADTYWEGIGLFAINLLVVIWQVLYLPGTSLSLYISQKFNSLRTNMIAAGLLNTLGCAIRYSGSLTKESTSATTSYCLVLFGTILTGLAQPFYVNIPGKIAGSWFGEGERDLATTFCSLANPLGSAIGSAIPALFVKDNSHINSGVEKVLLIQFITSSFSVLLVYIFFQSAPKTPPSKSQQIRDEKDAQATEEKVGLIDNIKELMKNKEYVKLCLSFMFALGLLNAIAGLINQLPGDYTNAQVGFTGSSLILCGFFGAFVTGFILSNTGAYKEILKVSYVLAFLSCILFFCSCKSGGFTFFIASASLLGLTILPIIPATIVNSVECTYPLREDLGVGVMYVAANLAAIFLTCFGQFLLQIKSDNLSDFFQSAPFFPFSWLTTGCLGLGLLCAISYQGEYLRSIQDKSSQYIV